jgi:hypothetical protein
MDSKGNIIWEKLIDTDLVSGNYSADGNDFFFFHTTAGGAISYQPIDNLDTDIAITKTFNASDVFNVNVATKRIFKIGTSATGIYIGRAR